ncbi:Zn-dependent hydrolase [Variovorax defluvii]
MIEPDLALAEKLFARLHELSFDGVGITRDTYGEGEQRAHDLMADTAAELGLELRRDAALNLYITLPGADRGAPAVMTGSHLDSVPRGGNYDGAAGVVAGMAVLAGLVKARIQPERDMTVLATRAEESAWFPVSYIGSKSAFGMLAPDALSVRRADSQRTLREYLNDLGGRPDALATGEAALTPKSIDCFVELHIEQGPVLVGEGRALGVVTGICGSHRYRAAQILGRYAHSGATPRMHRQDSVVGLAVFVERLQHVWRDMEAQGHELTLTFGQVNTDIQQADFSKVPGQVSFSIDIRSRDPETLRHMDQMILQVAKDVEVTHGVRFEWGPISGSQPAVMDDRLQQALWDAALEVGVQPHRMPSGAGHDASIFANQGVPTAMLFVRNEHGSHNPEEAMGMADFAAATRVLAHVLETRAGIGTGWPSAVTH